MNKQRLLSEAKSLIQQTQTEDAVFVGFLQTMSKYPAFSVMAEAGLHLHAPDYAIMLAPRAEWEQEHGTTVLPGSMPIPLLMVAENGDVSVDYVYDVQDTAGFNNGDSDIQALVATYTPAYEQTVRSALNEADAETLEDAVSRAVRKAVVKMRPQQPELMDAATEYIVRDRLNLSHEAGILQGIDRSSVDMEAFFEETRQLALPMLHKIEKAVHNGQVIEESEEAEYEDAAENATDFGERVRDVRGSEEGISVPEPQGDVAGNADAGDARPIPDAVPAGDAGESGQTGGADDTDGRFDGAAEEAGRDGVYGQAEQPAIAGHGNHAAGNPRLSEREAYQRYTYIRQDVAREAYDTDIYTEPFATQEKMAQELLSDLAALAKNGSTWAGDLKEDVELLVKSMHPARDMKLADWYATFNPEYADNEELADMTLGAFYDALVNGEDIYRVANIGGSDTRQALFYATALATGEPLTDIYTRFANGGSLLQEDAPTLSEEERQQALHVELLDIWEHRLKVFDVSYLAKLINYKTTRDDIRVLGELHERYGNEPERRQKIEDLFQSFNLQEETAGEEPASREQATPSLAIKALPIDHSFKGISFDRLDLEADMSTEQGRHAVFARNIAAVQIARHLEATGHQANKEELTVLRSYSGFGGLADAFDEVRFSWHEEYKLLHEIFTESELTMLIKSTRTAYYTPDFVTKAIAEGLSDMGFKGGNVLDPSTGSGRFLQALTPEQQAKSHMVGIELDPVTALVAKYANPDAEIVESGFERTNYPDDAFDLAITNVPFDNLPINDPRYAGNNFLIHDYFINRMVDEVRPGGLVVAVTSKGTMDKASSTAREAIARKAELLGSWRMPAEFFEGSGTQAAESDILVFRKRERPLTDENAVLPDWVYTTTTKDERRINRYYYDAMHDDVRTEFYLGDVERDTNRFGEKVFVAKADRYQKSPQEVNDQLASDLRKGIGSLPAYQEGHTSQAVPQQKQEDKDNRPYGYYVEGDRLTYLAPNGRFYDAMQQNSGYAVPQKYRPAVLATIKIRDKVQEIFRAELRDCTEMELSDLQEDLRRLYDNYTRNFGTITERTKDKNGHERYTMLQNILRRDASWAILSSLEVQDENGKVAGLSDIFTERTIHASRPPEHVDTAQEAVIVCLGEKGYIDIPYIADLAEITPQKAIAELEYKTIYDIGNGQYVTAEEYLSGDIRQKIDEVLARISHKEKLIHEVAEESVLDLPKIYSVDRYKERTFKPLTKPFSNPEEEAAFLQMALAPENRADFYDWLNDDRMDNLSLFYHRASLDENKPSPIREWLSDPYHALELITNVPYVFRKGGVSYFEGFRKLNLLYPNYCDSFNHNRVISYLKFCLDHKQEGNLPKFTDYVSLLLQRKQELIDQAASDPDLRPAVQEIEHLKKNLAALESVKPKDLTAEDIRVNLGAPWVPTDDIREFVAAIAKTDAFHFKVHFDKITSSWKIGKDEDWKDFADHVRCFKQYGKDDYNAIELIERIMNHTQTQVWKADPSRLTKNGKPVRVVDPERTLLVRQKMEDIRDAFQQWIFKDKERRERLVNYYNRFFNNIVPRKYDGSWLRFPGMNLAIQLYPHQKDAIARSLFGGNTLFAHVVGAGKSFEMQASAMEAKRLGICHKSMMIMPNFLTEQFGQEFHRLYPAAKILVAGPDDLDKKHRREFIAKITSQPWDAVVMSYEQFQKIPLSVERQKAFYEEQIQECKVALVKDKNHLSTKQLAARIQSMEKQLNKIQKNTEKHADNFGMTFEQLGCDRLYVDESHNFKNLRFLTRMSGMNNQGAEKTDDMLMKVAYLNDITGEHGLIFASGTPVSNSMSELYSIQRYLKPSRLQEMGLYNFDAWASAFGRETTKLELKPEGTGFAMKTRFSEFCNIPELISMFHEFADVKTADMLDLKVPDLERKLVVAEPSAVQKEMLADLCARADEIHDKKPRYLGEGEPDDDSSKGYDNMLVVTNDGRKLALDPRLCGEEYDDSDNKDSKVELCAQNVAKIFSDTADESLTQLVFCDLGTPKAAENGVKPFSVYDTFKEKLLEKGIPAEQVAFIHDYDTPAKKQQLFQRVRRGQVRILMGSSDKLGIGANVQDRVIAMHNLDCPWKPAQIEQRLGRGVRQGNLNEKITVYDYMTNGTFDAYMWQTNENKQRFISQIMTSRSPVRNAEDVDELVLDYATAKAACTGNPLFREQMQLQNDIARLEAERSQYLKFHEQIKHKLAVVFPENISTLEAFKENIQYTLDKWQSAKDMETLVLDDKEYKGEEIGKVLQQWAKDFWNDKRDHTPVGTYHGLKVSIVWDEGMAKLVLSGKFSYSERIVTSSAQKDAERLQNAGRNIAARLERATADLEKMKQQQAEYLTESQKPFAKEEEYQQKKARLQEVTVQIEQEEAEKELQQDGGVKLAKTDQEALALVKQVKQSTACR